MDIILSGFKYDNVDFIKLGYFKDGREAYEIVDKETSEPIARVNICLPDLPQEGCIWIKNWSENEGMANELVRLGIVKLTGNEINTGFVTVPEGRLIYNV